MAEPASRPKNSDLVAQDRLRQARTSREAHFSALNDEDEAWRNQDGQTGQDFADGTLVADDPVEAGFPDLGSDEDDIAGLAVGLRRGPPRQKQVGRTSRMDTHVA